MSINSINILTIAGIVMTNLLTGASGANAADSALQTTIVNSAQLYDPTSSGYSHAVVATGFTHIAYIAGQGGEDKTGALPTQFEQQLKQAYRNLHSALVSVNATPAQVTKITTYVVDYDPSMLVLMTRYAKQLFGDTLPAQTLVPVSRLALDGMLFEVDAVAVLRVPAQ